MEKAKQKVSWNDVKEKYLKFHRIDKFTENMAIDIDFGYWLANEVIKEGQSNPKVKQLEWHFHGIYYIVDERLGCYIITQSHKRDDLCVLGVNDVIIKTDINLEEAKTYAQVDFERRVKECLIIE